MKVLYVCDVKKNKKCRKTGCMTCGTIQRVCELTTEPKYAKTDENGDPIIAYARIEGEELDGGKKIRIEN